jgi:hypothetical protein
MSEEIALRLATEQFTAACEEAIKRSERTYDRFINSRLFFIARRALEYTERADPDKIARQLGQVATKVTRDRKTGRMKRGKRIFTAFNMNSYAALIVNSRRKKAGEKLLWGKELFDAVKRLRATAPKSVNFIRSGWIWAMQQVRIPAKESSVGGERVQFRRGAPKGFAQPAQRAVSAMVTGQVGSTSLLAQSAKRTGSRRGNPMPVATRGLVRAYNQETQEIIDHLHKKLAPELKPLNAK